MLVTRRLIVRGRVQGVWYRGWTVDQAAELGLDGWVRNRRDGSVEILAEGPEQAVATLIERCRKGPSSARVEQVEADEADEPVAPTPPGDGGFHALVIGTGGGRDLLSALVFGATSVDGVEINPIIVNDVMRERFREYSGGVYDRPNVHVAVEDGRSFVRRSPDRYDIIQASLVDTWAATAAGAYTLTENTLYTVEAFNDYLDHLNDDGMLTITRWVADGLRLVSLAQEACAARGWSAAERLAIVRQDRVATFLLKKSPFTAAETARLRSVAGELGFDVLYAPDAIGADAAGGAAASDAQFTVPAADVVVDGASTGDYARLILAADREQFYDGYRSDIRPTTDDRPFFFHTTKLEHQFEVAFGKSMLFGNGLSALLTLLGISAALVALFVIGPLLLTSRGTAASGGSLAWLAYFGALGAGFMLIEVSVLQRFVLLLGHPVYSLTVTLFSVLLGTGIGSIASRYVDPAKLQRTTQLAILGVVGVAILGVVALPSIIRTAITAGHEARIALTVLMILPAGILMGIPLPAGVRLMSARHAALVPWAWGMNGALSVIGATLAVFVAMNWGFSVTLLAGAAVYLAAATLLHRTADNTGS